MEIQPIGTIHTSFRHASGVPIQPVFARGSDGMVEVFPEYEEALADLEGFERIWLLCWFDRSSAFRTKVTPYLDDTARGLFATRAPARPNPIGLSCVRLLGIEANKLRVTEVDILDGTPLLDIKPYVQQFDCFDVKRNGWLDTTDRARTRADSRFLRNTEQGDSR